MGFNYWGTDSIATQSYDFSSLKSRAYKHDFGSNSYNFDFSGYYSPKTMGYSFSTQTSGSYSSNPVSVGYSFSGNSKDLANYQTGISASLANVRTLSSLKNDANLSPESKSQIEVILNTAKKIEKQAREHSTSVIVLESMANLATDLDREAAELFATCQEEITNALQSKGSTDAATGNGNPVASGAEAPTSSSSDVVEGDAKLDNATLAQRYGVSQPIITEMPSSAVSTIINSAGSRSSFTDTLKGLNNQNIVSFLTQLSDSQINSLISDIDDQSYLGDDDELSIKELLTTFDGSFETLKAAGYLSEAEYDKACKILSDAKSQVKDSFTDSQEASVKSYLIDLKKLLSVTVSDGTTVTKGTQKHFDMLIKEKQGVEAQKATNEFVKASAGDEYDDSKQYALPEAIKYLPNKKVFQAKVDGKTFEGKDFKELNNKIMNCKKEQIILAWVEIKKELTTSEATSVTTSGSTESSVNPFEAIA